MEVEEEKYGGTGRSRQTRTAGLYVLFPKPKRTPPVGPSISH